MLNKPLTFKYRSDQKELLDEAFIPANLLNKNLRELDILNRTTGGHAITLKGIKSLVTDHNKTYHIVDLGCGGGDTLKVIADWARTNNFQVKLTGVDVNNIVITYLNLHCRNYSEIRGITSHYQEYINTYEDIDILHCSLFCHHLNDDELLQLLVYCNKKVKTGFIINDLNRHWLPYYCAWFFTRLLNGSKLAKNDGPISVLRGFRYIELFNLLEKAKTNNFTIKKAWPFRFLVVGKTASHE